MTITEFTRKLKVIYHCDSKKVFECVKVAQELTRDAHKGCNIPSNTMYYMGYDHFFELVDGGEFDVETMKFVD